MSRNLDREMIFYIIAVIFSLIFLILAGSLVLWSG